IMDKVAGIRRFGSAALDLCYVAAGRYDGYFEDDLKSWDIAAGLLMVTEAGGLVTDFGGKETMLTSGEVVAGNSTVHPFLRESISA
ncbi:MAG: inositol monophosphatase family protein, partial [Alphaproteobacteria bacterium]